MNCENCGAPMQLFERRRYYFCRHCGSFRFLDAPDLGGVQVLAADEQGRACPVCSNRLVWSLLDGTHSVEYCQGCRGVLMPRRTFAEVISRRRAWASDVPTAPEPLDRAELQRRITCPSCRTPMEVHPYFGPGNVVIDTCTGCDGIWLDFGELKQIVDAPGRDRGRREGPAPRTVSTFSDEAAAPPDTGASTRIGVIDFLADLFFDN